MAGDRTTSVAPEESSRVTIRLATPLDATAILQCLSIAFAPYQPRYTTQAYLDTVLTNDTILERLASMTVLVAVDPKGKVVGTIGGSMVSPSEGHLRGMAVVPDWQGRNIAQALLEKIEEHLLDTGCIRISLDTTEPLERAMRFYERNGFRRTGKVVDFFGMPLIEHSKELHHN